MHLKIMVTSAFLVITPVAVADSPCAPAVECAADFDASGDVGFGDLLEMLSAWGPCGGCHQDLDDDGAVGFTDLLRLLAAWGPCRLGGLTCVELAGRSLASSPHMQFTRTFNEGSTIAVAIDPAVVPGGTLTCDVYVVETRTAAQWLANPALVDVRGAPQRATFDGPALAENIVELTGGAALSGDGGLGFGVGYDVVCDTNGSGQLDDGDLIDGLAGGAGFFVVADTTTAGPLATSSIQYSGGVWLGQRTWYPTDIATMDELPLVVIGHGNGHQYTWYDYLQSHLASRGYVVMSHQNQTGPGIETASTTTLANTDYFLGTLDTIAGGVLDGHVDGSRITWIGHSRGGEGVCRAYDRLFDGAYLPVHYSTDDIVVVSSIAPNDYLGRLQSNPHDVNYHLLFGAADGDNGGWPDRESDASFHVFERAEGNRQATYVHGADHNDFNCCGFDDFVGPAGTAIGRAEAQRVAKGAYLALIDHYARGAIAASEFLWRQYETLRPIGVSADTIVDREYREGPGDGIFVIDDFQTEPALGTSSSGGSVTLDVSNPFEGQLDDTDDTFTWSSGDPMNGMSRGRPDDLSRGLVFDWSAGTSRFLEFEVVPAAGELSAYRYLSFRACQGTRHPRTVAELADLTFTVTLRDQAGVTSSIDFSAYGAGIEEPYQRTGSGSGAGWQNEFETIRIRLTDFLHDTPGLDLTDVVAVRFELGAAHGSAQGRVSIDDVLLSGDQPAK